MIGAIHAACIHETNGLASMACGAVVYEVHVSDRPPVWSVGEPESMFTELWWIHEHAPQDAPHELYGFRERSARDLFRRLLDVKGVGPKVGMRIVASGAVASEGAPDVARLTSVRGVGAKLIAAICEAFT